MKSHLFVSAALCATALGAVAAPAEVPGTKIIAPQIDARAVALFDRAVAAYAKTPTLSQTIEVDGVYYGEARRGQGIWAFERPGRARLEIDSGGFKTLVVGNGTTTIGQWGEYARPLQGDAIAATGQWLFGGYISPLGLIFHGINPLSFDLGTGWQSAAVTSDDNGVVLKSQAHPTLRSNTFRVFFDPQSHLITRVENEAVFPVKDKDKAPDKYSHTIRLRANTARLAPDLFEFVPPAGKTLESMAFPAEHDTRLVEGADPFALIGKTLDGKAISLNDYRGKVVLLDFWATWCGPCVEELPTIHDTYRKYHDEGFEVIGISTDLEDSVLRDFIKEREMPWPQIHELMTDKVSNGRNYKLSGIPFALLIGRDGKIAALGLELRGWKLPLAVAKALAAPAP